MKRAFFIAFFTATILAASPAAGGVLDDTGWLNLGWGASKERARMAMGGDRLDYGENRLGYRDSIQGLRASVGCYFTDAGKLAGVLVSIVCEEEGGVEKEGACTLNEFSLLKLRLLKTFGAPNHFTRRMCFWASRESVVILGLTKDGQLGIHYYSRKLYRGLTEPNMVREAEFYQQKALAAERRRGEKEKE